jgi:hypothetical protein
MSKLCAQPISCVDDVEAIAAGDVAAAAVLSAYVRAEQMHVFRRLLCRRLALVGLVWIAFAAASSFIEGAGLLTGVAVLSVGGGGALFLEWRAVKGPASALERPARPGRTLSFLFPLSLPLRSCRAAGIPTNAIADRVPSRFVRHRDDRYSVVGASSGRPV